MKTIHLMQGAIILMASAVIALAQSARETPMKISSPDFNEGGSIPPRFTCDGENVNPSLRISGVPAGAKSLVLIVDDPDAPAGVWTHWLMWNLKTELKEIAVNSVPTGAVQGLNDFHRNDYGGPCPPSGTHRYFFKLCALDTVLELPSSCSRKALDQAMRGHVVAETTYMGRYERSR
jgi:Raf kinase inhibitor-like YbhB/YbcL family protein